MTAEAKAPVAAADAARMRWAAAEALSSNSREANLKNLDAQSNVKDGLLNKLRGIDDRTKARKHVIKDQIEAKKEKFDGLKILSPFDIWGRINKLILYVDLALVKGLRGVSNAENVYSKAIIAMYLPRIFFAILITAILLIEFIGKLFGEDLTPSNKTYMHLYSSLKLFYIFAVFCGAIFSAAKLSDTLSTKGEVKQIPFQIAVLASLIMMVPYIFDIVTLLIILGILKAKYISSCNGAKLTEWGVLQIPTSILKGLGILGLIISFIWYKRKKMSPNSDIKNLISPLILMCCSLSFIIYTMFLTGIENIIANNISYWLFQATGRDPGHECVQDEEATDDNNAFKKAANLILSIILGLIILAVFIIQLIPLFGLPHINMRIRDTIQKILDKLMTEFII